MKGDGDSTLAASMSEGPNSCSCFGTATRCSGPPTCSTARGLAGAEMFCRCHGVIVYQSSGTRHDYCLLVELEMRICPAYIGALSIYVRTLLPLGDCESIVGVHHQASVL